jgi:hypothetical protein
MDHPPPGLKGPGVIDSTHLASDTGSQKSPVWSLSSVSPLLTLVSRWGRRARGGLSEGK